MTEFNERVLDQAADRELLRVEDLIVLIERHDDSEAVEDGPGVSVDRLRAYVEEISREGGDLGPDNLDAALSERLTDADSWAGQDLIYEVAEDRVSAYPRSWHEGLDGVADLEEQLRFIIRDIDEGDAFEDSREAFEQGGPREGVPEGLLRDAASAVGDLSRDEAGAQLTELRKENVVSESADQHPNSRVRFLEADDVDEDKPTR